jgi:ABC-type phosphate transport system auxiliary subunit
MTSTSEMADLRAQLVEVLAERDALRAQLDGDLPAATAWLQAKVWRQRTALDALNRRVTTQRFVLRTMDGLGRSLTLQEYRDARNGIDDPGLRGRVDDPEAA